jgi:hypothetical protein
LTSEASTAKSKLKPRDANQDMCNRVNLDYFGTSTTTTSALPTATNSAVSGKMARSRASANLPMGIAFILTVFGQPF